jgi:predicted transcriptional regulator
MSSVEDKPGGGRVKRASLGEQELAVLRFIAEHAPVAAREVVEKFAGEQELARTTILTKMERLRKKGFLTRRRMKGVFVYSPRVPQGEVLQGLVRDFVEKTLGGSVSPFVAYLLQTRPLTADETAVLQRLAEELEERGTPPAGEEGGDA